MCVELNQTKKGVSSCAWVRMKPAAASRNSSSTVSIRFFVSGPVSSMRWVPSAFAQEWSTPRGRNFSLKPGNSSSVG